ncbi:regulation of nuclear pre-mRNA domain-containing protein 2 [Trichonephila inaurata madagascariensis]|uniref:Regulation of nuclear pre-mRNA domain-containing protein 2 n=1 Tax=Trichonephila inaurata madagascariensis TaxID=2747483 RepID=A0A8X6YBM5_9ARAC|nr:regulation of nuclear pre-mRNA domain-containing protein 2 [Trichonephila inaurata madagascariensis]
MSSSLSDSVLEKKFQGATNTQDSIQTLSLWLVHHKAHHQKIVAAWMKVLQKAKINHRLTLFHLANDVVQNSKRKGFALFVNSFAEVLKEATLLVRDEHIRSAVLRVFNIWEQRSVYSPEFIADLRAILTNSKVPATAPSKLLVDFKPESVIKKIRSVLKLEVDISTKKTSMNFSKFDATDAEIFQQLKDRTHGQQFKQDFDKSVSHLEDYIEFLNQEIAERCELILLLEQSEIFYDTQRGEAKVVANAYKNFDSRVKTLEKRLLEVINSFPSPVPSPSVDAPSPTTSDHELELNLPNDNKQGGMSSWLDAFSSKKDKSDVPPAKPEPKQNDPSSLDSRLSNLLQNIPNLPSGLQNTLFGGSSSGNNTPLRDSIGSPIPSKKDKLNEPSTSGALTPVKDEYSGQNTPLQDEDTHSSHSFFTKLASSNKTQNPKDILKGLTSLIQSATGDKDESQRKEKFSSFGTNELFDQSGGMSSFIKGIIPSISQPSEHSSSPSVYFTSSQSSLSASDRTLTSTYTTPASSYQTTPFDSIPSYSTQSSAGEQHLSYIPSLVPSTPLDTFNFTNKTFSAEEYNPEMEMFDSDMDLENPIEEDSVDVPSPNIEPLSPVRTVSVENNVPRVTLPARRLSTLITLTDENSSHGPLPDAGRKENGTQESMPIWPPVDHMDNSNAVITRDTMKDSPNEEFFIGKPSESSIPSYFSAPPPPVGPPNGENLNYIEPIATTDSILSRIETVQSQRESLNNRWYDNNWNENSQNVISPRSPVPPPPDPSFFNQNQNFPPPPPPQFQPRPNWSPQFRPHRPDMFHQKRPHGTFISRPYGPPPHKRFPFRGRGWGRNHPQY